MILALLLACNPFKGIEDRWNGAWEACDPESVEGRPDPFDLDASLSAECQDRLLDDLKADRAALEAVAATDETPDLAACVITGAYDLLTRDGGRFGSTEAGDGVYPVFLDQLQEVYWQLGGDDNRQLAYNYTAWFTAGVVNDDGLSEGAVAASYEDGLHLSPLVLTMCGPELGHVLFHEAGHAVLDKHVPCPEGYEFQDCPDCIDPTPPACDADEEGTYALSASLLQVYVAACEDPEEEVCAYLEKMRAVEVQLVGVGG